MIKRLLAIALLALAPVAAQADVILDDFGSPAGGTQFVIASQNTNPYTIPPTAIPGATRTTTFTVTSPTPAGPFSLLGVVGGGTLDLFFDSSSRGNAVVDYTFSSVKDFRTIGGPLGAIVLSTQSQATLGNPDVSYTIALNTVGALTKSFSGSFANSSGFIDQSVLLSSFTGSGDLSRVTGLTLTINARTADDFRLDKIALREPTVQQVPAPPALLLALVAVPLLGVRRYLGRKA